MSLRERYRGGVRKIRSGFARLRDTLTQPHLFAQDQHELEQTLNRALQEREERFHADGQHARATQWPKLSVDIEQRMRDLGYSGDDIKDPLAELFDKLAQYPEVAAVGIAYAHSPPGDKDVLHVTPMIAYADNATPALKAGHQRSRREVNSFAQNVSDAIDVVVDFLDGRGSLSPPEFWFQFANLSGQSPLREHLMSYFLMPLANIDAQAPPRNTR